jgi:hypothetical protein
MILLRIKVTVYNPDVRVRRNETRFLERGVGVDVEIAAGINWVVGIIQMDGVLTESGDERLRQGTSSTFGKVH